MDQTVTIKPPPTAFVTNGPELTFDLPLIPKRGLSFLFASLFVVVVLISSWVLGNYAKWVVLPLFGGFDPDLFLFSLLLTISALLFLSPIIEQTISILITLLSREPVLEIRPEGLVDRRILRRMVRWDEFESVGDRHQMFGSLGMPVEFSFKLKDRGVRRFSPMSVVQSFYFGGKRVAIQPYGFDVPPRVILDVILAMIRNAQANKRAA